MLAPQCSDTWRGFLLALENVWCVVQDDRAVRFLRSHFLEIDLMSTVLALASVPFIVTELGSGRWKVSEVAGFLPLAAEVFDSVSADELDLTKDIALPLFAQFAFNQIRDQNVPQMTAIAKNAIEAAKALTDAIDDESDVAIGIAKSSFTQRLGGDFTNPVALKIRAAQALEFGVVVAGSIVPSPEVEETLEDEVAGTPFDTAVVPEKLIPELEKAGIKTMEEILAASDDELVAVKGLGVKSAAKLKESVAQALKPKSDETSEDQTEGSESGSEQNTANEGNEAV